MKLVRTVTGAGEELDLLQLVPPFCPALQQTTVSGQLLHFATNHFTKKRICSLVLSPFTSSSAFVGTLTSLTTLLSHTSCLDRTCR